VVEDDRGPWWANDPELIEIRRRTVEEFDRELDQREPGPNTRPIPWSPTSSAVRACANSPTPATISNVPAPDMSTRSERAAPPGSRGARSAGCSTCQSSCCTAGSRDDRSTASKNAPGREGFFRSK
jgi:hypothetical protein